MSNLVLPSKNYTLYNSILIVVCESATSGFHNFLNVNKMISDNFIFY